MENSIVDVEFHVRSTPRVAAFSDSDIVPENYQNLLMYYRDSVTEACFGIGDVANDLIMQSATTGLSVVESRIHSAVGRYCGRSGRTVRYYAETAAFFDSASREKYDTLPFSHFVFARSMKDRWSDVLELADANAGISLDSLRYFFLNKTENNSCETSQQTDQVDPGDSDLGDSSNDANIHICATQWDSANIRIYPRDLTANQVITILSTLSEYIDKFDSILDDGNLCKPGKISTDSVRDSLNVVKAYISQVASRVADMTNP